MVEMVVQAVAEESHFMGAVQSPPETLPAAAAHHRPFKAPPRSKTVIRRAGCGSPARPDLWGAWGSDPSGLPDSGFSF